MKITEKQFNEIKQRAAALKVNASISWINPDTGEGHDWVLEKKEFFIQTEDGAWDRITIDDVNNAPEAIISFLRALGVLPKPWAERWGEMAGVFLYHVEDTVGRCVVILFAIYGWVRFMGWM